MVGGLSCAETALVALLRRHLNKEDEARAWCGPFVASADLAPDAQAKTLTVKIHQRPGPVHDRHCRSLTDLNELNFCHPENLATIDLYPRVAHRKSASRF